MKIKDVQELDILEVKGWIKETVKGAIKEFWQNENRGLRKEVERVNDTLFDECIESG